MQVVGLKQTWQPVLTGTGAQEALQEFLITSMTGVAPSWDSDMLILEANKRMLTEQIATDEVFLLG